MHKVCKHTCTCQWIWSYPHLCFSFGPQTSASTAHLNMDCVASSSLVRMTLTGSGPIRAHHQQAQALTVTTRQVMATMCTLKPLSPVNLETRLCSPLGHRYVWGMKCLVGCGWMKMDVTGGWVRRGLVGGWMRKGLIGRWVRRLSVSGWMRMGLIGRWVKRCLIGRWMRMGLIGGWVRRDLTGERMRRGLIGGGVWGGCWGGV